MPDSADAIDPADDHALARRVRSGDRRAEHELYVRYAPAALRRVMGRGLQRADAEDCVADAFLRVLRHLRAGTGPTGDIRAYLHASVRHAAADLFRGRRGREQPAAEVDDVAVVVDPFESVENRQALRRALLRLPARWRWVLWATVVEGRRPTALAAELGTTPAAVSALAYRARTALRRTFDP